MSQLSGSGYHIGGPTGRCATTGRALEVGEIFVATLSEAPESDDLARADYCLAAWEAGERPAGLFGYWRAVLGPPGAKPAVVIDDDIAMDLFEQLAEQTDPRRVAFRFVLALLLIRRRRLVCEETRRAGADGDGNAAPSVLLVRRRGDPRPPEGPAYMEVIDPGLDEAAIEGIMEQFEAVIGGEGLTAPVAAGRAPSVVVAAAPTEHAQPRRSGRASSKKRPAPGEGV